MILKIVAVILAAIVLIAGVAIAYPYLIGDDDGDGSTAPEEDDEPTWDEWKETHPGERKEDHFEHVAYNLYIEGKISYKEDSDDVLFSEFKSLGFKTPSGTLGMILSLLGFLDLEGYTLKVWVYDQNDDTHKGSTDLSGRLTHETGTGPLYVPPNKISWTIEINGANKCDFKDGAYYTFHFDLFLDDLPIAAFAKKISLPGGEWGRT